MLLNSKHELALHLAICRNNTDFLDAFIQFDRKLLEVKIMKNEDSTVAGFGQDEGQSLLHYAIICNSDNAIEYLVDQDNNCVNELCNYGTVCQASVIHLAYAAYAKKVRDEDLQDKEKAEVQLRSVKLMMQRFETEQNIRANIKLFLTYCSKDILITEKSGSVLFLLIKLQALDLIETIFNDRFKGETEFLVKFATTKDHNGKSPMSAASYFFDIDILEDIFEILLAHGAIAKPADLVMFQSAYRDTDVLRTLRHALNQNQMVEMVITIINLNYYLLKVKNLFVL